MQIVTWDEWKSLKEMKSNNKKKNSWLMTEIQINYSGLCFASFCAPAAAFFIIKFYWNENCVSIQNNFNAKLNYIALLEQQIHVIHAFQSFFWWFKLNETVRLSVFCLSSDLLTNFTIIFIIIRWWWCFSYHIFCFCFFCKWIF